jgi:hypothetical protein
MAAAAIEALFFGNSDLGFDADPGAVVIWFSDDPNLNEQTRLRLLEASDKLSHSHLVKIEPPFDVPRLEPRKVYFLNAQKLGKNSLLVRGHVEDPSVPRSRIRKEIDFGEADNRSTTDHGARTATPNSNRLGHFGDDREIPRRHEGRSGCR